MAHKKEHHKEKHHSSKKGHSDMAVKAKVAHDGGSKKHKK